MFHGGYSQNATIYFWIARRFFFLRCSVVIVIVIVVVVIGGELINYVIRYE